MFDFGAIFSVGLPYADFLKNHGSEEHRRRWADLHARVQLTKDQQTLIGSFKREMKVVCLAGTWCGDCVNQCPIFERFAAINPRIVIRYFDRDTHSDLTAELKVCGGARVPVLVFLSEDNFEVGRYGDRTLSKYRKLAADQFGPACPTGLVPPEDWLDEFERAQLILRTSARLRQKHGD